MKEKIFTVGSVVWIILGSLLYFFQYRGLASDLIKRLLRMIWA